MHRTARALAGAILLALLTAAHAASQLAVTPPLRRVDLAGDWRYLPHNGPDTSFAGVRVDDRAWPTMRLPSNWFLLGSDRYPRNADRVLPSAGPGEIWTVDPARGLDWGGTVWYRKEVEWQGDGTRPVLLELDMVDYYAEAFVNGASVGKHEGYFERWAVDVSRHLRRGPNVVTLRVSAPTLPFDMSYRWPISWPKQQDQVKGIFLYHDTRPGATSPRGQERSTGGVIRGLELRETSGVEVEELRVTPMDVSAGSARLVVEAGVRNWTGRAVETVLRGEVRPGNFPGSARIPVEIRLRAAPGITRGTTEVRVERPALWWTWDHGRPNLYRLDAALRRDSVRGELLDRHGETFGIRSITRDSAWVFRLNGRRIYPRGTNYIATQWLSQADRAWYERDVDLLLGANLNAVRVHAHLERPEFYEVADSAGILVWQDFPLQWGYTDSPEFHAEALRQAEAMIRRFGNHPSIALWCMHNESPHAMEWMRKTDPEQNLALDEALLAVAVRMDPSRVHHRDSGTGDGHPYAGWYYGRVGDLAKARTEPHITEYGAQATPGVESLRTMVPGDSLFPAEGAAREAWVFHDFQPTNTFGIAGIPQGRTVDELVEASQAYQARVVRYATELFRRRKWAAESPTTGVYQFMFVEDWPSVTWAVVDYERRVKPGYAALRASMQPVLPSIEYRIDDRDAPLALHVVNDLPRALPASRVRWRVVSVEGVAGEMSESVMDVPADTVVRIADLGVVADVTRGGARLEAWVEDATGLVLGRSTLDARDFEPARRR